MTADRGQAGQASSAALRDRVKNHPVIAYFLVVFAISYGGLAFLMVPGGIPGHDVTGSTLFVVALVVLALGPAVAGPLMTYLVYGRAGLRDYRLRLLKWRVGVRWYAVAVLTIFVLCAGIVAVLSLFSSAYLPQIITSSNGAALVVSAVLMGLFAALMEELGWTGFAVPGLLRANGLLSAGLVLGAVWALWHLPITYWASGTSAGTFSWSLFLPPLVFYIGALPAYRVLMVWVYARTQSIFVPWIMHASLIACTLELLALSTTALVPHLVYWFVLIPLLWILVFAVTRTSVEGDLPHPTAPLPAAASPAVSPR
jgi:CAAX protease family protein